MIQFEQIQRFFPKEVSDQANNRKYMLKEYIQLMILGFLSTSQYVKKIALIGGTGLRLAKGIDRFSEDLDFDCKQFSQSEFEKMTEEVVTFLRRHGLRAEARDRENRRLKAFRRCIYFPEFLFDMNLSGYKEERFMIKIESQDQGFDYLPTLVNIRHAGFFFPFPMPPDAVLCAMKISALLSRKKGRDFYDTFFLLQQTVPDYNYLSEKCGISNIDELKTAVLQVFETTGVNRKLQDFTHLLFDKSSRNKALVLKDFIQTL
ncbi:MAG: nucleotidyl transferase AbiEii/AbiGii toxin family protein [Bacteroidales bacterium]|jgi:predicted nucleotidyltransferase component of viral defense system|nr:nucleotidyl transferase AbiEii/AbiGii toxin family protein [Bacteroidales bacterium]